MDTHKIIKNLRISKNITVEELSISLGVSPCTIKAIESGDFSISMSKKHLNNILKKYSIFFELDFRKLKKYFFEKEDSLYYKNIFIKNVNQNFSFFGFFKVFSIVSVFLFLFFYIGIEIKNRYSKPDLFIASPTDNFNTDNKEIVISGKTISNAIVKINGEFVLIDSNGAFTKDILLNEGLNVIRISASKDKGEEMVVTKRVILENDKLTRR